MAGLESMRNVLDGDGFVNAAIMSHATKFASAYYGPFREAADCAPSKGDRKAYQMDFRNPLEALREAAWMNSEGADVLMVKPGLAYLDIIQRLKTRYQFANCMSTMYRANTRWLKAAAERGWIDEQKVVMETMHAFARAGASIITTYHIKDILNNNWI